MTWLLHSVSKLRLGLTIFQLNVFQALDSILLGRTSKPSNVDRPYFAASAEVRHLQPNEEIHEAGLRHFDNSERLLERNKKTMVRVIQYWGCECLDPSFDLLEPIRHNIQC